MHKRNIALTAAVLSAIIAGAFVMYPWLSHFVFLRWLYFPAILLSVFLSGSMHSPSAIAVWVNFVFSTLFYWVSLLVLYAFLCELRMLRQVFHHLGDVEQDVAAGKTDSLVHLEKVGQSLGLLQLEDAEHPVTATDTSMYLEEVGKALKEVEERRRKHFLLQNLDSLDLSQPPRLLAAQAITQAGKERPVKVILKRLESKLAAEIGSHEAAALMTKLMPLLAAQAITQAGKERLVEGLPKRLESKLAAEIGAHEAAALMTKLMPLLAAQAITQAGKERLVKSLPKRLASKLAVEIGARAAAALMTKLKEDASTLTAGKKGAASESISAQ